MEEDRSEKSSYSGEARREKRGRQTLTLKLEDGEHWNGE